MSQLLTRPDPTSEAIWATMIFEFDNNNSRNKHWRIEFHESEAAAVAAAELELNVGAQVYVVRTSKRSTDEAE